MGHVSAEARGLVRIALQQIFAASDDGLPQRFSAVLEARVERLTQGKRLTIAQVDAIKSALDALTPYRADVGHWRVYGQSRKLILASSDPFSEQLLEIRAMRLDCTRRRVRYDDHPLGLQITSHALARLVERGRRGHLVQLAIDAASDAASFFAALRLGHGADLTFAIPFSDGLAFGEYTNHDHLMGTLVYEADTGGSGFSTIDGPTALQVAGGPRIGARISSYLSADQLNPRQDEVLGRWRTMETKFSTVWRELGAVTIENRAAVEQPLLIQSLGLDVKSLVTSDLWASVIRPSRPAIALAAAQSVHDSHPV